MRCAVLIPCAFLAAAPPAGACPTRSDVDGAGVAATHSIGTETFRRLPDGRVLNVWTEGGDTWSDLLGPGGVVIAYWKGDAPFLAADEVTFRRFDEPRIATARPMPGLGLSSTGTEGAGGGGEERIRAKLAWSETVGEVDVAGCSYTGLTGTFRLDWGPDDAVEIRLVHLRELDLVIPLSSGNPGAPEPFGYTAFEPVE
ncbi:hypothetical protein JQC91_15570 [Jannaschia sp. Os4]|uniref:hypothetical protein n=1 Tax=Jannaschia sp. Os4 TaxID=2807617 RepID=UPI0019398672|nr:hypothetical protein [Jannaschia sp. Os4]MBM2577725.1 hypothetical protein [Jannaschia sp. Os4]